jgi:signal transduction histidine kinase
MLLKSIRTRMAVLYSSVLLVTLLAIEILTYLLVHQMLSASVDETLRQELLYLRDVSGSLGQGKLDPEGFDRFVAMYFSQSPIKLFIQVEDSSSELLYKSRNLGLSDLQFTTPKGEEIEYATITSTAGMALRAVTWKNPQVRLCIATPVKGIAEPLDVLLLIFLILTPAVVVLSGVGGYSLARFSLRPIDEMSATAQRITTENLDLRIPNPQTGDEVEKLANAFNELLSRLHNTIEAAKQFPASAAHELRNSLHRVRLSLDEALMGNLSLEHVRTRVATSLDEVNRLTNIVESLLTLAMTDVEVLRRDFKEIHFDALISGLYWDGVILGQARKIRIVLEKVTPVRIIGDERLLRQLFFNLIDNSIKYNHEGGQIRLSLTVEGTEAVLTFSDTGIGIPPEEIDKVFERFYRGREANSLGTEGVGLGLALVKWIVEVHGGKITLESEVGKGSTFKIFFPGVFTPEVKPAC